MRKFVTNVLLGTMTMWAYPRTYTRGLRWLYAQIVIVPERTLVTDFLMELVKWPSKWRTFWATRCPEVASRAVGGHWEEKCTEKWRPELLDTEAS